jgi:hypothetical protein
LGVGKIGFNTLAASAIDFSIGDVYAGDSENLNVISSLSADNPLLSGTYDVLTVPEGTSPLLGKASALPSINDTSATGAAYNLAGTVATYGALDMRGLSRPTTGQDIGNYEVEVASAGNRPLRRTEVGVVAATYPNSIQVNSITQGVAFSQQLSASFGTGTLSWSAIGILPPGISLTSGGFLSGTSTTSGSYPVIIRVTDANGSYAETNLTLTVISLLSNNANLANLVLSSASNSLSLSPTFNSNTVNYTATVSNLVSIQVTPTVSDSNATVKVNGTTVSSGTASGAIRLRQNHADVEAGFAKVGKRDPGELGCASEAELQCAVRVEQSRRGPASSARLIPRLLEHLGADAGALQGAQVFDEHLADKVIHLVLDAFGQQSVGIDLDGAAAAIERTNPNHGVPHDLVEDAGHGQAALLAHNLLATTKSQLRVDEHERGIPRWCRVHDDHAFVDIHLSGCETDAIVGIHRLDHVVDQLTDAVVYNAHRFGNRV